MELLKDILTPAAALTGVPIAIWLAVALLVIGALGHLSIHWIVRRLGRLADRTHARWDDVIVYAISPPAEWAMWVFLLYLSLGLFDAAVHVRETMLQAADTGLALLLGWLFHRLSRGVEIELLDERYGPRDSDDRATITALASISRIVIWVIAGLMVLQSFGVSVQGLLAFGGIGGIAVGFAAKDLLANFLGGLSIYLDRPFAVGDWIRSPDRDIEGVVEKIGWRVTVIRTFTKRPLYVPNATFSTVAIENPTRMENRRIFETIGIRYDDAERLAPIVAAVKAMVKEHPAIDPNVTQIVNFTAFGASSLDFFVYCYTKTINWVEYHEVKQDVLLKILAIITAHGAEVAFPTRTLHMVQPEPADDPR
jgi:MscS family membrane protein